MENRTNNIAFIFIYAESGCDITKVSESMQHDFESLDSVNSYVADLLSTEPTNGKSGIIYTLIASPWLNYSF